MKTRYVVLSILFMVVLLFGSVFVLLQVDKSETNVYEKAEYEEKVFNQTKVSTIDIQMSEADLQSVLNNPLEKEVIPATIVFNGKEIENVGFRTKGNMTLRSTAQLGDSERYSFKIDFDYYNDGQNLYGLKKWF